MRRSDPKTAFGLSAACALAVLAFLAGAGPFGGKTSTTKKKEPPPLKVDETVGDLAFVRYSDKIRVEGVGLVVGLDGTGSEAEPSAYRTRILNAMRKARVEHAERWLSSNSPLGPRATSIVIVRGMVPVGITNKDRFDINVELTPASTTTSLAGGHLVMSELNIVGVLDNGTQLDGASVGWAGGSILIDSKDPKKGIIPGGARVRKDLPYTLVLKDERKGGWVSAQVQRVINSRFFELKGIEQEGMARAKTDQVLVLNVPHVYHDNQARYFQVLERLSMVDAPELRARRQADWAAKLLDPATAGDASLRLEGLGRNSIDTLKTGLASKNAQVRYFAAESLAYLGDPSGVGALADAAVNRSEFRAFAFAALAALDDPAAHMKLRDLMAQADPKVRYGAFNALRTADPTDPDLGRVRLLREARTEAVEDDPGEALALQITVPRRKATRPEDPYRLYIVDCDGPPMIHVTRTRRPEIVVFGRTKLETPIVLGGSGSITVNAALGDENVQVSRIRADGREVQELSRTCSPDVGEIVREMANLDATYPEVVSILEAAYRQKNLDGPVVFDAIPVATPDYERAQLAGVDVGTAKRDPTVGRTGAEVPAVGVSDKDESASKEKSAPAAESSEKSPRRKGLLNRLRRR